jgi:hypothetical protein
MFFTTSPIIHSRGVQVGCGPTATHFSCFAKKSKQKKATQASLPFGFPIVQDKNGESQKLAFGSNSCLSFSHFCPAQLAVPHAIKTKTSKLNS